MKTSSRRRVKRIVLNIGEGLLRSAVDTTLYFLFLTLPHISSRGSTSQVYNLFRDADDMLSDINYDRFKNIISDLTKKGYTKRMGKKRTQLELEITTEGKKRLAELLPTYRTYRPWDGHVYLVSYDIAEKQHSKRDMFRQFLRRIGCGFLQESLWVTPYHPSDLIEEYQKEHYLRGTVLVSKLGNDGAIGEEDLVELMSRVYKLSGLNQRYAEYLEDAEDKSINPFQSATNFLSILSDDPQLPFALLPKDWLGDKAYKSFVHNIKVDMRPLS